MVPDRLKTAIEQWIKQNRSHLPLNVDSWQIQVMEGHKEPPPLSPIMLGRYDTGLATSTPFYKPYSKIAVLK